MVEKAWESEGVVIAVVGRGGRIAVMGRMGMDGVAAMEGLRRQLQQLGEAIVGCTDPSLAVCES